MTVRSINVERLFDWLGEQLQPIRTIGVGATEFGDQWSHLRPYMRSVACDPLHDAGRDPLCEPLPGEDGAKLPVAVSAFGGDEQLNVTRDPRRSSLLEPNWPTVVRHGGVADFEVVERRQVPTTTLPELAQRHGPIDVLRLDCQGLEYQLLSCALSTVCDAVCIEVAGGLVDNYVGQYPFAAVSTLLCGAGYVLMDLTATSRPKTSAAPAGASGLRERHQPVEYRALWLRDYSPQAEELPFHQAIKLLVLCHGLGYRSIGGDLVRTMYDHSLLPDSYARLLQRESLWRQPWPIAADAVR